MISKRTPSIRLMQKDLIIDARTEAYVLKRVKKLEKFCQEALEYEIELCRDKKDHFCAELMVKTPYNLYRVEEKSESVEGSVDVAVDNIKHMIVRDKVRIKDLKKRGARSLKKKTVIDGNARFKK